jgi:Ca2+-binding RTX toxin-like protein
MGEGGNDLLDGGEGIDYMFGGEGNDVFVFDAADSIVDGEAGIDTLRIGGSGQTAEIDSISPRYDNIEVVDLTGTGDNHLVLTTHAIGWPDHLSGNILRVEGNAGDSLALKNAGWMASQTDPVEHNGNLYQIYTWNSQNPAVWVDTDISVGFLA